MKRKRLRTIPAVTSRCDSCVRLKTKCTGVFPCAQCFALCQQCVPVTGYEQECTPYMELALSRLDPRSLAEPMLQAFFSVASCSHVKPDDARLVLRMWRSMSLRTGTDVTHGVFEVAVRALGIHPLELESGTDVCLDRHPSVTIAEAAARRGAVIEQVRSCQTFKALDDGRTMLLVMHLDPILGMTVTTNEPATKLFASAEEVQRYISKEKVIFSYLIASMISPEDRQVWFELQMASVCSGSPPRPTAFVKFCNRDGRIDLYIMRYRVMHFPEFPGQAFRVVTLERAPQSRHITERPSRRYRIVDGFRQGRSVEGDRITEVTTKSDAASDDKEDVVVPGFACLPLPLPDNAKKHPQPPASAPRVPRPPPPPALAVLPPMPAPLPALPIPSAAPWQQKQQPAHAPAARPAPTPLPYVKCEEAEDPLLQLDFEDQKLLQELLLE